MPIELPRDWIGLRKRIIRFFCEIEFIHKKFFKNQPFLSYAWLINETLGIFELERFSKFTKKLQCKKRCGVYRDTFTKIMSELRNLSMYATIVDVWTRNEQPSAAHVDGRE